MKKVQAKLKNCIENQSLKSLDRLADALETTSDGETSVADDGSMEIDADDKTVAIDASETMNVVNESIIAPAENKVLVSKRSKRKQKHSYRMKAIERKKNSIAEQAANDKPKRRHRYHCAF